MLGDWFIYGLMTMNAGASLAYAWEGAAYRSLYWATVMLLNYCLLKLK